VADEFCGKKVFLFGAHPEDTLKGSPKQIIAKRHGAICVGTKDGAVWISHMKEAKGGTYTYKLKSVQILGEDKMANVPRSDYEIFPDKAQPQKRTYRQIWYEEAGDIGILHYDFYNGAMGTGQCNRLKDAYLKASRRPTKVLVLSGGLDFFSNGVDLNNIHAAPDPAMESWYNINAINGICKAIVLNTKQITLSAVHGGAGAGGVYLAIASDYVAVRESSILNPHYKTMGLYGSELHTYTAPQRVGVDMAYNLKEKCLPISAETAKNMKLVDYVLPKKDFHQGILSIAKSLAVEYPKLIKQKVANFKRSKVVQAITVAEAHELSIMYDNFVGTVYNNARNNFVKKSGGNETPAHLVNCDMDCFKVKPVQCPEKILDGEAVAENMKANLVDMIAKRKATDPSFAPGLAIIQVGNRADSALYIKKKLEMAKVNINYTW
jgi:putative two-component system protein, hydrogenase maturation factor HypX/HoxX